MSAPLIDSYAQHPIGLGHPRRPNAAMSASVNPLNNASRAGPLQNHSLPRLSHHISASQTSIASPRFSFSSGHTGSFSSTSGMYAGQSQYANGGQNMYASPTSTTMTSQLAPHNQNYYSNPNLQARRTPSGRTTTSTSSSSTPPSTTTIRRSSSSRSQPTTSYVALLRKQKATVWCDRSQAEDPRILAAQRLAKERAEREVALAPGQAGSMTRSTPPQSHSGSFTTGVARKIRHHGVPKAAPFTGNMAGQAVPMRLSANEVDDDDEDIDPSQLSREEEWAAADAAFFAGGRNSGPHRRTSSGRSSLSRATPAGAGVARHGSGSSDDTATGKRRSGSPTEAMLVQQLQGHYISPLKEETPLASKKDYFSTTGKDSDGSTPEDEDEQVRKEDELRRRGSVDDRAMTMSGVRLFVANPDLDD